MGRQWLQAKREVANLRKGAVVGKLTKEIAVAAKLGGADPDSNARLFAAVEKARRNSVTRDAIERAIKKGAGIGGEKLVMEHIVFEGYAPHKVAVIVEALTDNNNRTAPDIRLLFKKGQLGAPGSNKFLFEHVGLVEAHTDKLDADLEEAAIEAGANEVEPQTHEQNEDIPAERKGARFICDRTATGAVSKWLSQNGWTVVTSEFGYLPKNYPELTGQQREEVGEFLQALDDNDDVHRVWAALK
ncbi:MAG: YebC/PmpR family DNA-binding transcriptional regulator [Chthoniobacteraceae bacterium]